MIIFLYFIKLKHIDKQQVSCFGIEFDYDNAK